MVAEARGRMFRRKDGNCFLYLPRNLVEDSAFPFNLESSVPVQVVIDHSRQKLLVMPIRLARTNTIHSRQENGREEETQDQTSSRAAKKRH
jgi:hypothetical protein